MGWITCAEPSLIPPIGTMILAAGLSYAGGLLIRKINVVDEPDGDRKTQTEPVPRLGGVAIFAAIVGLPIMGALISLLGVSWGTCYDMAGMGLAGSRIPNFWIVFPLFPFLAFLIGLWDDFKPLSGGLKLLIMFAICALPLFVGWPLIEFRTPFGTLDAPYAIMAGCGLWLLVFTNAANFMDGANGLSTGCMAIMLVGLHVSLLHPTGLYTGVGQDHLMGMLTITGAIIGFLIHNLRGKLYAGDAGSLGLGALFASLGLVSGVQVWTVATLALPFLIDVLMTLIWRARHGRPWLKPHLDHAYQKLRLSGWSHIETAFLYWGLSTVCAVAAIIAAKADGDAPFFVFCGLCLSGIILWSAHRRSHPAQV